MDNHIHFEEYFKRQIELWGAEKQKGLLDKKIAIIGCGGLGSSLALALGGSGIGEIHLVDFDTVSTHNIHRQIAFCLADEGQNKAQITAKLLKRKNPFLRPVPFAMRFEEFVELGNRYDLIIDATDNLPVRAEIDRYAKDIGSPWIYGSVEEFHGQVCFFENSDFGAMNISDHQPAGIAAPIVMHIASIQANLALRYLVDMPINKDKLYYLYFDKTGALQTQKFGMPNTR